MCLVLIAELVGKDAVQVEPGATIANSTAGLEIKSIQSNLDISNSDISFCETLRDM